MQRAKELSLKQMRRMLWMMGVFKIPLIAFVCPKLIEINDEYSLVKIKLRRKTKNHLKSMYFGALAVGADVAAGLHAFYFAEKSGVRISFVFKEIKAEFLKRATSDVTFVSNDGLLVKETFKQALFTKERINKWVNVLAKNEDGEIVANFKMQISVKVKA